MNKKRPHLHMKKSQRKQRDCKIVGEREKRGTMKSPSSHLGVSLLSSSEVGLTSSNSYRGLSSTCPDCVREQQTVKLGFLSTCISLCVLAIAAEYRSHAVCPIIFHPPLFSYRDSNWIHKIRLTRIHSLSCFSWVCLCFHSIWLHTHRLKHTHADWMTKQE